MKTHMAVAGVLLAGWAVQDVKAQQSMTSNRVADVMPSRYTPPNCGLKPGHFKVSSGAAYLKTGVETEVPANQTRALKSGERVLVEAITENDQAKNPAAWYYLGRVYLEQGDIVGADSAFTKAETMAPACKQEIATLRNIAWVPLVNAGIGFAKQKQNDSALALFRQANIVYRDKPSAYLNGGVIFANSGQVDSAIVYWQKAAEIAERTNAVEDRNIATRNLGAMYQRANRHQDAIQALEKYLTWSPKDAEVKRALVSSYRATGQNDKAAALEKEVGAAPSAGGSPSVQGGAASAMNAAITLYNEKKYDQAAAAFEKVVATEPYNRDALFGLANAYIGLKNGPKLAQTAERLVAIEPMNEEIVRMLANGLRMSKKEAQANKTAARVLSMPVTVSVDQFAPSAAGATISGTATGREAQTLQGKPVPPAPMTLVFEFLDAKGTVVTNQEVQIPALKPGESHAIQVQAQGPGITAWRYKQK
ncbi:MAG TPA: tetratricopeptide repeat protein [Gemmatimonadales bacterium]|nr:tetratricopeptide repeat protein [Gemmatimonadales bacterium]